MADPPTLKTVKSLGGHSYPAESPPPPALKTVESLGGHRYLSDNPTESTPLTEASVGGSRRKPSMELAMTRSRLRLVRTPEGRPWSFWGLAAPFANYELLGAGASAQVRIAGECLYLFAFLCLFGLPLYYWSTRNDHPLESNTAAGWSELRWGQALLEFAISVTFIGFIAYNQYRLMDAALHEVKHESKVREKAEGCTELMQEKCMGTRKGSACLPTSTVSREYADEPQKIDNVGLMLRDSHLVEACSVVLTGWGRGKRMPAAALDDLATVTGARPVMAVQAARSLELEIACERLAVLETRLAEARDQPEPHAETVARLTAEQREAAAGVMRLQRRGETLRRRPEEDLLDYAFITFASSEQRARVLEQASVLQWRLDHHGTKGARVLAAPHPGDVAWRNLEATQGQRRCSTAFFLLVMYPGAIVIGITFSLFCVLTPLLGAQPWPPEPLETWGLRFGYFVAIISAYGILLQMLLQPLMAAFTGTGMFGFKALRITCNTYTCIHAKVGSYWLLVELIILSAIFGFYCIFTIGDSDYDNGTNEGKMFAYKMTVALGVPKQDIDFYYLWKTECMMNIVMAAFAECFAASWLVPALPQYLIAPFARTQVAMDEWVRIRNPGVLPFTISDTMRILAVSMWWSGIFPVQIPCAFIYYCMANFVARSNLLGRIEPGPPTKPLQYRLVFGVYLPFHMLLRFLFTAWIYMDVPLMRPNEEPFGNLTVEHWSESPQNAFHFGYSILFAVSILVLLPLWARRYALRKGVLTPFELLYLWFAPYTFSLALEDLDFSVTARVQRGIQSLALADRQRSTFVLLPPLDELHRDARYRAPNGLDLLAGEKSEAE